MTQITIPNTPATVSYSITAASTGPFTVPFPFFTQADVKAKIVDGAGAITELVHSTDFTFDSLDVPVAQEGTGYEGGVISLNSASGIDGTITVYRDTGIDRTANFPSTGPFDVALLNDQMNRLAAMMQEFNRDAVSIPAGSIGFTSAELPTPLALSILRWNATASSLENLVPDDLDALSANAAAIAAAASEVAAAASAAAALSSEANVEADAVAAGASEIAAAASAVAAAASEVAAEAARDAAIVNSTMYADEATGRAAVADTEYFKVIGSGNVACYEYVRVDASNSTLVAVYPSSSFVESVEAANDSLENVFTDVLTVDAAVTTVNTAVGRIHSPDELATMLVTPVFVGEDPDTPVVPVSVTVTGKNILNDDSDLWETGRIDDAGVEVASGSRLRLKDLHPIAPDTTYSSRGGLCTLLYDAAGTFIRDLSADGYVFDAGFTTAANETQFRSYVVMTNANPYRIEEKSAQIEKSAVSTDYEQYYQTVKNYDSIELFAFDTYIDSVTGNELDRKIYKYTVDGSDIAGPNSDLGTYYSIYLTTSWFTGKNGVIVGHDLVNGDFPASDTWNIDQKQIYGGISGGPCRINVANADITAAGSPGAYLNANPVEVFLKVPGGKGLSYVADGALIIPAYGSMIIEATGGTTYDVQFQEIGVGSGGGGAALTGRVDTLETNDGTQDSTLTSLQTQIDDLIIGSGTSDAEVIAARTSAIGAIADTTLKNRLDRMEETSRRINVQDYGAVGDGVTDDTVAILAARDAAEANDMALHFPRCADAYMIRNGILLTKSTVVTGVEDGRVKKIAAVTSDVNGAINIGDTVIPVDDASLFTGLEGYDVYVGKNTSTSSYNGLRGTIVSIDTGANTVTVSGYNNAAGTGMAEGFADGGAVLSTTFPMIYTDQVVSGSTAISPEVIGVHLDGNVAAFEPKAYTLSLIHYDTNQTTANKTIGCVLRNSPADAMSDQGNGKSIIAYNRMYSNAWHGIHIGFTNSGTLVVGNYANGNGQDGMYFCYGNTNTRCVGNFFESSIYGFAEVGVQEDGFLTFSGNITKNCIGYQIGTNTGTIVIDGMLHYGTGAPASFDTSTGSVKMSGASHGGGSAITLQRSSKVTLDVDFFDFTGTVCVSISEVTGNRSSFISVFGQMHGATVASVTLSNSDNCLIAPSISQPAGTVSDIIVGSTCDNNHLGFGIRKNGVTDSGTNTVDAML